MKFKIWLETVETELKPRDIYDFYYITTIYKHSKYQDYLLYRLKEIAQKYIYGLGNVLKNQIQKYVDQDRVDSHIHQVDYNKGDLYNLKKAMAMTYRSDMTRRNANWDRIADNLLNLQNNLNNIDKTIFYIDRLNNDIHNTGDRVLEKLGDGYAILNALDTAHKAPTPRYFMKFVSSDLRKLDD